MPNLSFEGRRHLEDALDRKRGVLCVSAHLGSIELGAAGMARFGRVHSVAGIQLHGPWTLSVRSRLHAWGVDLYQGPWSYRRMERALRNGGLAALPLDGDQALARRPAPFLGTQLHLPLGPAWLAARTGAAVLPTACLLTESGWNLIFHPPIKPDESSESSAAAWHLAIARAVEGLILAAPDQWVLPSPLIDYSFTSLADSG
ncbi:MAG: lysophospholipid acyltransferase family protein [Candidatus Eisenbacteria bacterium]|uniref:Lysophospholipid acyltransferase family protein n=1 Tax=Eiseniibacteriota bacterium TaxID=2212470 RepID=A0A948RTB6_UNCEI|nr:lysophospholipid acyltransferase family protein [Candidatus Eisenbacteria bacterium]MBU1947318.1 lysophospholipid acyltransferase family protein [Candidatus Eisenbacteria bacterium]MBU2689626.1 lysophospholipid acyltransferase family protein [Candidatus Eisenbacteria bacterium]